MQDRDLRPLRSIAVWCALVAVTADEGVDARALLKAQAAMYARLPVIECRESLLADADPYCGIRGESDAQARVVGTQRLILDVPGRRYRFERMVAKPGTEHDARPVLVMDVIETGSEHRLERLSGKDSTLRIRWDSDAKRDPGLFDQSAAWQAGVLWPLRSICLKAGLAAYVNRNGILAWIDGRIIDGFLADPRLTTSAFTANVLPHGLAPEDEVRVPGVSLVIAGRSDLGEDPENRFAAGLLRMPWNDDVWLVHLAAPGEDGMDLSLSLAYRRHALPGADPVWLPRFIGHLSPAVRVDAVEMGGPPPSDDVFRIDYSLAKDIYDETARMPIIP